MIALTTSIAATLPRDILHSIFTEIEKSTCRAPPEVYRSSPETVIECLKPAKLPFTKLRLVCREWKVITDTFLFRNAYLRLVPSKTDYFQFKQEYGAQYADRNLSNGDCSKPSETAGSRQYFHKELQLRELYLGRGYGYFIRRLDIVIDFENSRSLAIDDSPQNVMTEYAAYVLEYVETMCEILRGASRCMTVDIFWTAFPLENDSRLDLLSLEKVTSTLLCAFNQLGPEAQVYLHLQAPQLNESLNRLGYEPEVLFDLNSMREERDQFENWLLSDMKLLFSRVTNLTMNLDQITSPSFLFSLKSLRILNVPHLRSSPTPLDPKHHRSPEAIIGRMKSLKGLRIGQGALPPLHKGLEYFYHGNLKPYHDAPEVWQSFASLPGLLDLDVHFQTDENFWMLRGQLGQPPEILCLNLRSLSVVGCNSWVADQFCASILENARCLEYLRTTGVNYWEHTIDRTSSVSLAGLSFNLPIYERPMSERSLQFSSFTSLFERNPALQSVEITDHQRVGPFSFEDIDRISTYCMNLTEVNLVFFDLADEHLPIVENLQGIWPIPDVLSLPWLYARSNVTSPVKNEIIRRTVRLVPKDSFFETLCVSIDLAEFRRWKERLMGQPRDVRRPVWPTPYNKETADWRDFS
jgi:hypothetical protein